MKIALLIIFISLIYSCSPVRTSEYAKGRSTSGRTSPPPASSIDETSPNTAPKGRTSASKRNNAVAQPNQTESFERFKDTTFIYLGEYKHDANKSKDNAPLSQELLQAIKLFDDGETNMACERITGLLSNMNKENADYYETLFYASECYIAKNSFEQSQRLLVQVLSSDVLSDDLKERAIVRLGQVFCVLGDAVSAERLFRQLRREFPKSIYISIANCESVSK